MHIAEYEKLYAFVYIRHIKLNVYLERRVAFRVCYLTQFVALMICQALKIFQACYFNPLFADKDLEDGEEQRCHSPRTHSTKSSPFPATGSWNGNSIKCQGIWRFKVGQRDWNKASRFWPRCIIFARRCRLPASVYCMQRLCVCPWNPARISKDLKGFWVSYGDLVFPMRPWPCPKDLCAAAVKNARCSAAVQVLSHAACSCVQFTAAAAHSSEFRSWIEYPAKLFFQLLKYYQIFFWTFSCPLLESLSLKWRVRKLLNYVMRTTLWCSDDVVCLRQGAVISEPAEEEE